jgi:hypothetical protein
MLTRNNRGIVTIRDVRRTVAVERLGKHVSAETNLCNNRRGMFSVRSVRMGYKKDSGDRLNQLSSGVGSCSRELRRNGKKRIRLCQEDFILCCSDNETAIIPLP